MATTTSASTFIAVYRGRTASDARLIAVSADPGIVADVVGRILTAPERVTGDPVVQPIDRARRRALRLIRDQLGLGSDQGRAPAPGPGAVTP